MDLVMCRPCGRITTQLIDLMKDTELSIFYVFFAKLKDFEYEQ
jgi:hypothetical protein